MKISKMKKLMSLVLCIVLVAALALVTTGCGDKKAESSDTAVGTITDGQTLGTGATKFTLKVVDVEGKEVSAEINTDEKTVGAALTALNLIAGEQGEYGLYIKTVNGVTLDYEKDGKYWAFYADGEYAIESVDLTEIVPGSTYTLKAE